MPNLGHLSCTSGLRKPPLLALGGDAVRTAGVYGGEIQAEITHRPIPHSCLLSNLCPGLRCLAHLQHCSSPWEALHRLCSPDSGVLSLCNCLPKPCRPPGGTPATSLGCLPHALVPSLGSGGGRHTLLRKSQGHCSSSTEGLRVAACLGKHQVS